MLVLFSGFEIWTNHVSFCFVRNKSYFLQVQNFTTLGDKQKSVSLLSVTIKF